MTNREHEVLDPTPEFLTLKSGFKVKIEEMRLRQTTRLMKIVTRPVSKGLINPLEISLDPDQDEGEFAKRLALILITVIPEAENEVVDFLLSMVTPGDLIEKPVLEESDIAANKRLWATLDKEMINPSKKDTINLIKAIVRREASELQELGKGMWEEFQQATKKQKESKSQNSNTLEESSSEESPGPSTQFNGRMDGPTNMSRNSHSEMFAQNYT